MTFLFVKMLNQLQNIKYGQLNAVPQQDTCRNIIHLPSAIKNLGMRSTFQSRSFPYCEMSDPGPTPLIPFFSK